MGYILKMFSKALPLLCLVVAASAANWPNLRTTFGLNPFGNIFYPRPMTAAGAESEGWQLLDSCAGQFLGQRYADPTDPSLILIYDEAGYIAGSQNGLLLSDLDLATVPFDTMAAYTLGDFFGTEAYFTTAYFVDPAIICAGGRSEEEFNSQGLGDRLLIQTGSTEDLVTIPLTQDEADNTADWFNHFCFLGMGEHYMQFNYEPDQSCFDILPVQILYDGGVISGWVWQHMAMLPGDKWEHPDEMAVAAIIDRPPVCVGELLEAPGLSTMHHYFYDNPWFIICPFQYPRTMSGYRKVMAGKN